MGGVMCKMKIEGRELIGIGECYLDPVTYVPPHAVGNAGHADCELGVIIDFNDKFVMVLYCKNRTMQATNPNDLVWG